MSWVRTCVSHACRLPRLEFLAGGVLNAAAWYAYPFNGDDSARVAPGAQWRCDYCGRVFELSELALWNEADVVHDDAVASGS